MNREICQRYLETSIYTYVGVYKDFIRSLPDDIPSIGRLVCNQITHPSNPPAAPELDLWIMVMRVTAIWSIGLTNTGI